jgi:hypothetical protein
LISRTHRPNQTLGELIPVGENGTWQLPVFHSDWQLHYIKWISVKTFQGLLTKVVKLLNSTGNRLDFISGPLWSDSFARSFILGD